MTANAEADHGQVGWMPRPVGGVLDKRIGLLRLAAILPLFYVAASFGVTMACRCLHPGPS